MRPCSTLATIKGIGFPPHFLTKQRETFPAVAAPPFCKVMGRTGITSAVLLWPAPAGPGRPFTQQNLERRRPLPLSRFSRPTEVVPSAVRGASQSLIPIARDSYRLPVFRRVHFDRRRGSVEFCPALIS